MKKSICFLIAIFVLLPAQVLALEEITYWVNDEAGVISPEYEQMIVSEIEELNKNTSVQMAVATINSLNGAAVEEYSINLAHNILGEKNKDNGILILISIEDRKWRIEIGYGIEPYITDAMAGRIGRDIMAPYFQQGNYGEGILQAVIAIKNILEGKEGYELTPSQGAQAADWLPVVFTLIIFAMIIVSSIIRYNRLKHRKKENDMFDAAMFAAILFGGKGHGGGISGGSSGGFGGFGGGGFGGGGASGGW